MNKVQIIKVLKIIAMVLGIVFVVAGVILYHCIKRANEDVGQINQVQQPQVLVQQVPVQGGFYINPGQLTYSGRPYRRS